MIPKAIRHVQRRAHTWIWAALDIVAGKRARILFLTEQNRISESQIFPFYFFRKFLAQDLGFNFREIAIKDFQRGARLRKITVDVVFLQPWWDIEVHKLQTILNRIRNDNPRCKIVFLDGFAPLDLRLAQFLNGAVDVYVKKHVFRDRDRYGKATRGDTNLVDYYSRLYNLDYPETFFPIPSGFLDKLVVGPSFATAENLLPTFVRSSQPVIRRQEIDLHARLGCTGTDWYSRMRKHAIAAAKRIPGIRAETGKPVGRRLYMKEMQASKMCFSPFGYGEVCWRDYEAIMSGALLIKPDMSHVQTDPDIFRPYESYVPVSWEFSDLEDKVKYFLNHETERRLIVQNAYLSLRNYFSSGGFLRHVDRIMNKLGVSYLR